MNFLVNGDRLKGNISMLSVNNIRKCYRKKEVLKNINFTLKNGEICGLLGKNGAGKSTLIKIMLDLVLPDQGKVTFSNVEAMKLNIGYLSENITLYSHLNAYDNLNMFAMMAGVKLTKQRTEEILETVNLPKDKKSIDGFSMGMKRRLQLATVLLLKEYKFIILDEPTNGLDLEGMLWFKESMKQCKNRGQTILMASHAISEIQENLTDYMILSKGTLVEKKNISEVSGKSKTIHIQLSEKYIGKMKKLCEDNKMEYEEWENKFQIISDVPYAELNKLINQYEIEVEMLSYEKADLESHFLKMIRGNEIC